MITTELFKLLDTINICARLISEVVLSKIKQYDKAESVKCGVRYRHETRLLRILTILFRNKHDVMIHSQQVATGVEAADLCMNRFSSPERAY